MWGWLKRKKDPSRVAERVTERTNVILSGIGDALDEQVAEWQLIEYGRYDNKPTLARILRYVVELPNDNVAISLILQNKLTLDGLPATNPHQRLTAGTHIFYLEGVGSYRFETTVS